MPEKLGEDLVRTESSLWSKQYAGNGLNNEEVKERLLRFGENIPEEEKKNKVVRILWAQISNPLMYILLFVTLVSYFLGDKLNSVVIGAMLSVNCLVGFWQEFKAVKSIEKLRRLINFQTKVIRNGKPMLVNSKFLVPGDIVIIHKGDKVPADIKLIEVNNLQINEANLTGESVPVEKGVGTTIFTGTLSEAGFGKGVVTATGKNTELGKSVVINKEEAPTAFELGIHRFNRMLLVVVIGLTFSVFILNSVIHHDVITSFILGVSLALGITPEIFPIIIMISVSTAAFALSKNKVVVKRLNALEDIGNLDVICTDKTGTITDGKLVLCQFVDNNNKKSAKVLSLSMICNAYNPATEDQLFPNPLDEAIYENENCKELKDEIAKINIKQTSDFSFETKYMKVATDKMEIIKGQAQTVLEMCKTGEDKNIIQRLIKEKEDKGWKCLAVASKENDDDYTMEGLICFEDKARKDLKNVFTKLDKLNIKLKIITGDTSEITQTICKEAGVEINGGKIINGSEISKADDVQLERIVNKYNVFAKTTPKDKQRIILALRELGHNVGYMGDGVNDVGALNSADVAIAVGNANDVCKDVADIILIETDLGLVVKAVIMGRKVFANTTKFIANTMSSSFGNVISIAISSAFLSFIPMLPSQVLLIDSLSDIQHLTIANDNVDEENLKKPSHWNIKKITSFMVIFGLISTVFDLITIFLFSRIAAGAELFRSIWYVESNLTELFATFSIRTHKSFFRSIPGKGLVITSAIAIILAIVIPFTKIGDEIFGFQYITAPYLVIIIAIVATYIAILEYAKKFWYEKEKTIG